MAKSSLSLLVRPPSPRRQFESKMQFLKDFREWIAWLSTMGETDEARCERRILLAGIRNLGEFGRPSERERERGRDPGADFVCSREHGTWLMTSHDPSGPF